MAAKLSRWLHGEDASKHGTLAGSAAEAETARDKASENVNRTTAADPDAPAATEMKGKVAEGAKALAGVAAPHIVSGAARVAGAMEVAAAHATVASRSARAAAGEYGTAAAQRASIMADSAVDRGADAALAAEEKMRQLAAAGAERVKLARTTVEKEIEVRQLVTVEKGG